VRPKRAEAAGPLEFGKVFFDKERIMNASKINTSYTRLYNDGLGILLWGYTEMNRQIDELIAERRASLREQFPLEPCVCGCGEMGACDAQLDRVALENDELPF
jgi:hypothetical protein